MTDVTAPLMELRAAYRAMQSFERDKKEELKNKYREQMEDELKELVAAEKYAFSKRLKAVKEQYGLRVNDIQDHVLRTRNWRIWENLRDAAGIEPEQVTMENTKRERELANRAYRWEQVPGSFTGWAFIVTKDEHGNPWHLRTEEIQFRDGRVDLYADPDDMESAAAFKRSLAKYPGGELKGLNYAMRLAQSGRAETGL